MPSLADAREAIASYFRIPVFQADPILNRLLVTLDLDQLIELATEKGGVPGPRAAVHEANQAGVAAAKSRIQLMNPPGSGVDIKVLQILSSQGTSGTRTLGFVNLALATAGINRYMDQRIGITPDFVVKNPSGSCTRDTNAASGIAAADTLEQQTMPTTSSVRTFVNPVVLPPGFGFRAVCETVNLQFRVSIHTLEVPRATA